MKVGELMAYLSGLDENLDVYISSDAEGNNINKLYELEEGFIDEETKEFYFDEEIDVDDERDYIRRCLILWPF